jgi:hypothetical protein
MNKNESILEKQWMYLKCKFFFEVASIQQPSSNKTPTYNQCRDKCNTKHIKGEKNKMNNSGGIWNVDKHQEHDQTLGTQWVPRTWCAYLTLGMWWTLKHTMNTKNTMNVWIENTSRQTLITQQMPKMQRTLGTSRTPKTWQLNKLRTWWITELGTWQESRSQRTNK